MASERTVKDEVATLDRWSEALAELHERVAHRFRRLRQKSDAGWRDGPHSGSVAALAVT